VVRKEAWNGGRLAAIDASRQIAKLAGLRINLSYVLLAASSQGRKQAAVGIFSLSWT
jgi:hypothetical protein